MVGVSVDAKDVWWVLWAGVGLLHCSAMVGGVIQVIDMRDRMRLWILLYG
jgi:hypothetical protein